jgi:hypothetical protein
MSVDAFNRLSTNQDVVHAIKHADIPAIIKISTQWQSAAPDLAPTAENVLDGLNFIPLNYNLIKAAIGLAAQTNTNPYHGNKHFLDVFILSAALGYHAYKDQKIDAQGFSYLLTAALIHDYKHDGGNNRGIQYRLEKIAIDAAEQTLRHAGATDDEIDILRALIYTTDVSKDFSSPKAISPAESVKLYSQTNDPNDLKPELRILHARGMTDIALMLEDSDIGGGMICPSLTNHNGRLLAQEQGRQFSPSDSLFFLEKICHGQAYSLAGKTLLQPFVDKTMRHFGLIPSNIHELKKAPS